MKQLKLILTLSIISFLLGGCSSSPKKNNIKNESFDSSEVSFKSGKVYIPKEYQYSLSDDTKINTFNKWVTKLKSNKSKIKIQVKKGKYVKHFKPNKPFFITGITVKQDSISYVSHSKKALDFASKDVEGAFLLPITLGVGAMLDVMTSSDNKSFEPSATQYLIETSNADYKLKANPNFTGVETYNLTGFTNYVNFNISEFNSGFTGKERYGKSPIILNNINIHGTYNWKKVALEILKNTRNKNEFKNYMHKFLVGFDSKEYYDSFFSKAGPITNKTINNISEDKAIEIILQNI